MNHVKALQMMTEKMKRMNVFQKTCQVMDESDEYIADGNDSDFEREVSLAQIQLCRVKA
jgi:hypothetical protein